MTRASKSPSATWCTVVSTGTGPWPFLPRTGWSSSPATVTRTSSSASRYSGYSSSESSKSSAARSRTVRCASTMEPTIPTRPAVTRAEAGLPDPVRPRLARCLQPSDSAGAGLRIRAGSRSRSGPPVSDEFAGGCYHQSAEPDDDVDLALDDGGRGQAEPAPVGHVAGHLFPAHDGDRDDGGSGRDDGQAAPCPLLTDRQNGQEQGRHGQDPVVSPGNGRDEKFGDGAEREGAGLVSPPVGPYGQDQPGQRHQRRQHQPRQADVGAVQRAGHRAEQALVLGVLGRADPPGPQEGDVPEVGGGGGENDEAEGDADGDGDGDSGRR